MQHALDILRPFWPLILALVVWPIVGAALSWWLWWDTPAHWDAYAAAHPGRALAIRALRTVSPHLRKLVVAWQAYAAARSSLPPLSVIAEKQGALDVSATRPSGLAHPAQIFAPQIVPPAPTPAEGADPADEDAHASIVPPAPFDPHRTMRGSVDVRSLLAVVVAVVCVAGCPVVREAALRATPGVPDPADCRPGVQRCMATPDGMVPVVCSHVTALGGGHREWPALSRDPADGRQRVCSHGCVVDADSGVAHCLGLATDGGAL